MFITYMYACCYQAMKEREVEIGVRKDVLTIQKRTLNDEKSHLIADIKGCEQKTDQLQKKYDMVMSSLGKTEDGEQFSVTYFKIKVILRNCYQQYVLTNFIKIKISTASFKTQNYFNINTVLTYFILCKLKHIMIY